jgi:hypothetical protein
MDKIRLLTTCLLATMLTPSCLIEETRHTLYIEADGAASWVVESRYVRSDARDPEARAREESTYLERARQGDSDVGRALHYIGAHDIEIDILRADRPFTVRSEGRFHAVDQVVAGLFDGLETEADVTLQRDGARTRLDLSFRTTDDTGEDVPEWLLALIDDPQHYRVVLARGRFVEARGFRLEHKDTTAIPLAPEDEDLENASGRLTYTLIWTDDDGTD